jgi:hypothetical protein
MMKEKLNGRNAHLKCRKFYINKQSQHLMPLPHGLQPSGCICRARIACEFEGVDKITPMYHIQATVAVEQ